MNIFKHLNIWARVLIYQIKTNKPLITIDFNDFN